MKKDIHPDYRLRDIKCVCGATYSIHSTSEIPRLEICAACHPFFTGQQKYVDTAGRVEKFKQRYGKMMEAAAK